MRESIRQCYEVTQQLWQLVQMPKEKLQDEHYEKINHYLDQREKLLKDIHSPFTAEEKEIGIKMVHLNKEIEPNLVGIKQTIAMKIKNLKKREQSTKQYLGYAQASPNGYFYDKKN
ncbi:hypothetical protein [Bacillus sp. JJ722]|uniref:hypothetical protein n=1 Tax=Bacillus sp. JJ722 TaxID=3122973 RepID=UPI002FFD62EB